MMKPKCGDCKYFEKSKDAKYCGLCTYSIPTILTYTEHTELFCKGYEKKEEDNERSN